MGQYIVKRACWRDFAGFAHQRLHREGANVVPLRSHGEHSWYTNHWYVHNSCSRGRPFGGVSQVWRQPGLVWPFHFSPLLLKLLSSNLSLLVMLYSFGSNAFEFVCQPILSTVQRRCMKSSVEMHICPR